MAEVSHLEAAFERITVTDENEEQLVSTATYHKAKVALPAPLRLPVPNKSRLRYLRPPR